MIKNFDNEYKFLSNFYESPLVDTDRYHLTYPTVEHFFQAMKTENEALRREIANASTPGQAKKLGRRVPLRKDWEKIKQQVMYVGLTFKFENSDLRQKLLETGDEELVEGNTWHDNYWGTCTCPKCGDKGKNMLGKLLMELRENLKKNNP